MIYLHLLIIFPLEIFLTLVNMIPGLSRINHSLNVNKMVDQLLLPLRLHQDRRQILSVISIILLRLIHFFKL